METSLLCSSVTEEILSSPDGMDAPAAATLTSLEAVVTPELHLQPPAAPHRTLTAPKQLAS